MNNNPIGVFDSGVGGLSCVPAIAKELPNEQIIYFGDTARAPYGCRDPKEIIEFSLEVVDKLIGMGCKSLSIACNTITAVALDALERHCSVPVIGIIPPVIQYLNSNYADKRIGVIATEATVKSGAYPYKAKAASLFVPNIEATGTVPDEVIREVLDDFVIDIDVLVLGCTHYPFARPSIERLYKDLIIVDPAEELAKKTKEVLTANNLLAQEKKENIYLASKVTDTFNDIVRRIK